MTDTMLSAGLLRTVLWTAYAVMAANLLINVVYLWMRRGRRAPAPEHLVSIMIPARNEEANLRRLLPSLLAQRFVRFEILVYDDGSEDGTSAVVSETQDERVRLLVGTGPPPGWVGKVHALYQATRSARGEIYLFLDADTALKDDTALLRMLGSYHALPVGSILTAFPHFRGRGGLLVSAIGHALLVTLPLPLVSIVRRPFLTALNGQCWLVSRDRYHDFEPHERHAGEVLEDIQIGRFLTARGVIPYFADLRDELEVWMYRSFADAWRGFRKNAYLVLGGRPLPFVAVYLWIAFIFVAAPFLSAWLLIPMYLTKLGADRFGRLPIWISLLTPVTFLAWAALHLDSAISHTSGRVRWKGRDVGKRAVP